jgi:hypothetical protein
MRNATISQVTNVAAGRVGVTMGLGRGRERRTHKAGNDPEGADVAMLQWSHIKGNATLL